jgi:hypothetical protein
MPRKEVRVPTIVDEEAVSILENGLLQMPGVNQVDFDPANKVVAVQWADPAGWDEIGRRLEALGYFPVEG